MDRLGVYNDALRICGERKLASLTEAVEPRRLLDAAWDDNFADTWLEEADWKFATRASKLGNDESIDPPFGVKFAYNHPEDMARLSGIYQDEYMQVPLRSYRTEGKFWFTEYSVEIYITYVSNDASFGGDIGLWPASFGRYVAAFLANEIAPRLKNDVNLEKIEKVLAKRKLSAESKDAIKNPSRELPKGTWTRSRLTGSKRDGSFR